jgi:hypothetical protein
MMNPRIKLIFSLVLAGAMGGSACAENEAEGSLAADLEKHQEGSQKLAGEQDELAADVQELIEEQTAEDVIKLLEEVEEIMAEVIGSLDTFETGGTTIAAETEIIEKIFDAAQKRAQQSGGT